MTESIFDRAVAFAAKAHAGQLRKDGSTFILHPLEDAVIVGTMTDDLEILAAAVLHDTVEDTDVTLEELSEVFGQRVADLVAHETEEKHPERKASDTWKLRKTESLEVLRNSDRDSKMLWLGDKLSNIRALARDYRTIGDAVFERFNQKDPREQRWYYATILEYLAELEEYAAYREYEVLFHYVFDRYAEEQVDGMTVRK